jgi:hypothetical protein
MRNFDKCAWPGLLALVFSGAVLAHDSGGYNDYQNSGWSGNVMIWGNPAGQTAYSGNLSYSVGYGYTPGYVPWLEHRHVPQCHHGQGYHGDSRGYENGYRKGRKHGRKHKGRRH